MHSSKLTIFDLLQHSLSCLDHHFCSFAPLQCFQIFHTAPSDFVIALAFFLAAANCSFARSTSYSKCCSSAVKTSFDLVFGFAFALDTGFGFAFAFALAFVFFCLWLCLCLGHCLWLCLSLGDFLLASIHEVLGEAGSGDKTTEIQSKKWLEQHTIRKALKNVQFANYGNKTK